MREAGVCRTVILHPKLIVAADDPNWPPPSSRCLAVVPIAEFMGFPRPGSGPATTRTSDHVSYLTSKRGNATQPATIPAKPQRANTQDAEQSNVRRMREWDRRHNPVHRLISFFLPFRHALHRRPSQGHP